MPGPAQHPAGRGGQLLRAAPWMFSSTCHEGLLKRVRSPRIQIENQGQVDGISKLNLSHEKIIIKIASVLLKPFTVRRVRHTYTCVSAYAYENQKAKHISG